MDFASIKSIEIPEGVSKGISVNGVPIWSGDVPEVYHTVTFVMGGHGTQVEPQTVVSGETATQPTAPTADGWDFIGWFSDSGFTSAFSFSTPITADITLYAKWVEQSAPDGGIYGVEWNYSNDSPVLTRTGSAATFSDPSPATSLSGSGSSPFDNIMPWAGTKRYNIVNGVPLYSEDDARFDPETYDTMVYIPEFYFSAVKDTTNTKWTWQISSAQIDGFEKHPGSGRYVGRYHTSGSSSGVFSKSGALPLVNKSQTNFRTYSKNKGAGWYMNDIATWSALQLLYLVEYANFDSQTTLGTGYAGVTSAVAEVGATDNAAYHTLKISGGHNQYRWIEDPFSNCYDWLDGFLGSDSAVYAGTNNASFDGTSSNLASLGFALPTSGAIRGFGYSAAAPWAFIPDTASGTDYTKYVCDRVYSSTSSCPVYVGGSYSTSANSGLFYFNASDDALYYSSRVCSRLLFIPQSA